MQRFYKQFIAHAELCFEVGANVGTRVDVLLSLGARVVAIEPQAACLAKLKRYYAHRHGFTSIPAAVGAVPGEAEMLINDAQNVSRD